MIPITDGVDECPICLEEYDQKTSRKIIIAQLNRAHYVVL